MGATVSLRKWSLKLYLPSRWRGVAKLIYAFRDFYEPELNSLSRYLPPGGIFVDVGANYGIYTLVAARIVGPSGRVLSFEPASEAHNILLQNIALNGLSNVSTYRCALSEKHCSAVLYQYPDPSRNSFVRTAEVRGREAIIVRTLDEVSAELDLDRLDYLKIDTEGADALVLRGAKHTIEKYRPVIQFEHLRAQAGQLGITDAEIIKFFVSMNYEVFDLSKHAAIDASSSHRKDMALQEGNVLAIPKEKL